MFSHHLLLDAYARPLWYYDLEEKWVENWNESFKPRTFFINCENFQTPTNVQGLKLFRHTELSSLNDPGEVIADDNHVTLKGTSHFAPSDVPTIVLSMSSIARLDIFMLQFHVCL